MDNIYFDSENDLQKYIADHSIKSLGVGREGVCFLLDNELVIKKLYRDYYPDFALQFKDLDFPSFVFARSGAFIGESIRALFMEYADGDALIDKKPFSQDILTLGKQLEPVVKDIIDISKEGVLIKDFHCGNIIYDSNKMKIIDTLPYLRLANANYQKENICEVMNRIYSFLLGGFVSYPALGAKRFFLGEMDKLEHPEQYFGELREQIERTTDSEIKSLEDAYLVLKKKYPR